MKKRERQINQASENTIQEEMVPSHTAQSFRILPDGSDPRNAAQQDFLSPGVMRTGLGGPMTVTVNKIDWGAKKARVGNYFDEGVRRVAEVKDELIDTQNGSSLVGTEGEINPIVAGLKANEYLNSLTHLVIQMLVPENQNDIQFSLSTVSSDLKAFSDAIKILASLIDDPQQKRALIESAVDLTNAFGDLLRLAHPGSEASSEELHGAALRIAEKAQNIVDQLDQFIVVSPSGNSQVCTSISLCFHRLVALDI